jgi:hypothetical protein
MPERATLKTSLGNLADARATLVLAMANGVVAGVIYTAADSPPDSRWLLIGAREALNRTQEAHRVALARANAAFDSARRAA